MPRNQSEKDPARAPLLAYAKAAQEVIDYHRAHRPFDKLHQAEFYRLITERTRLSKCIPPNVRSKYFDIRTISEIIDAIYQAYPDHDAA